MNKLIRYKAVCISTLFIEELVAAYSETTGRIEHIYVDIKDRPSWAISAKDPIKVFNCICDALLDTEMILVDIDAIVECCGGFRDKTSI